MISSIIARHRKKFMSFMSVGALVFLLSNLLLFGLVSLGVSRWVAYVIRQPMCTLASYALNQRFTWRTRRASTAESLIAFVAVKLCTSGVKLGMFVVMTYQLHIHYLVSNILLVAMFGLVNYNLSDKLTFRDKLHSSGSQRHLAIVA